LTHQWQFQRLGWNYLWRAVRVQVSSGLHGYNYQAHHASKDEALRASRAEGKTLMHFNMEQQGDLARDYYIALKQGHDESAWKPYIDELRAKLERKPFGR